MNRTSLIIFILFSLFVAFGIATFYQTKPIKEATIANIKPLPPPKPHKNRIVHYRVPKSEPPASTPDPGKTAATAVASPATKTLPIVFKSGQSIQETIKNLLNGKAAYKLFQLDNFIQKLVVTIDNLPEKLLPTAHLPITAPAGKFLVAGTAEAPQGSSENYKRYNSYMNLIETIEPDIAIKIYTYYYPLFQSSFEQLGYKNAYFNDRLVSVIDHLIVTPNPPDPIQFKQPLLLYTYADLNLEKLSSGQKILLRMGQEQRLRAIAILVKYRQKLTNLRPLQ